MLNVVKFTVAAGLMTLVLSALSTAPVGVGWRMLLAIIATVIAFMFTRPVRSFKAMAGMDPNKSAVASMMKRAVGTAVGTVVGNKVWDSQKLPDEDAQARSATADTAADETAAHHRSRSSRHVRRCLRPAAARPARRPRGSRPSRPHRADRLGRLHGGRWPARPADQELVAAPQPTELPAAPDRPPRALPAGTTAAPGPRRQRRWRGRGTRRRRARPSRHRHETAVRPTPAAARVSIPTLLSNRPEPAVPDRRAPAPGTATAAVVYPTGIIRPARPGLYRSSGSTVTGEGGDYLRFTEPQVDENGQETWEPIYHAEKAST